MHKYSTYKLTNRDGSESIWSACINCGCIESKGSIRESVCSGKMHKNCTILQLRMIKIKENETQMD